ncbi:MAG: hypothetical protein GKS00_16875 [Alphaproteobacteria bacterium]|nr:hypothetical protein [Alphaproteobacteria bacterium]
MNTSIIFKRFEAAEPGSGRPSKVDTTVYFPYDFENVYEGGESLCFSDMAFQRTLADKICNGVASKEMLERIAQDFSILHMLASLHSLDPFVFRSKAEQAGVSDEIHDSYFAISPKEWARIRKPIREKISRLVTKAVGGGNNEGDAQQEQIERFLKKIWQAKDVEGIEPFIKAMQIEPERAPDVFFAWKAVCYYQVRFDAILEDLKAFFQWVGDNTLCYPSDFATMAKEDEQRVQGLRDKLRDEIRGSYVTANTVLAEYEESYKQFVHQDRPQSFMGFLGNSDASYLALASHVSNAAHAISLWKLYLDRYGDSMPREQFMELFSGLTHLYGVKHVGEVKSWDTEAAE